MATEKQIEASKKAFQRAIDVLDKWKLNYHKEDKRLEARFMNTIKKGSEDAIQYIVMAEEDKECLSATALISKNVPSENFTDASIAVAMISRDLIHGAFRYDMVCGTIIYTVDTYFEDSIISADTAEMVISNCIITSQKYYYMLNRLVNGESTLLDFFKELKGE